MTRPEKPTAGQYLLERISTTFRLIFPFMMALFVAGLILLAVGKNPLDIYWLMAKEAFGNSRRLASTLSAVTPLLFTGVATAVCFRTGIFNIGVEGVFILGGLAGAFMGFSLSGLPTWLHIVLALGFAALVGMIWLLIPGILRARWHVDEVVSCLMLNFVALGITGFLVNGILLAPNAGNNMTPLVHASAKLPRLIPPSTLNAGLLIALALLLLYGLWTRQAVDGYESKLVGLNPRFATATGISVPSTIVRVMVLSGIIAGLGGGAHALGVVYRFTEGFSPGYGFTGMAVTLLGRHTAWGIFFGALIFGALSSAGTTIQLFSNIPLDLVNVLEGTVMIFAVVEVSRLRRRKGRAI